ncbi:helix-turn-helix transcriptional regulator [Streptomyces sp. NPDC048211]|uniref:helix-turn-helix transcriptional regulator n=1 Tax=Streptomyces sp. NPDC048211 TaxID=3365516 RepID=UPI0037202A1D
MCHPGWGRARIAAQHLSDLARLRRVRDRIDREYARPLNVEALARGANVAAGQLSRQFRLAYGTSPYAYLMARRIERGAALLRHGGLSVAATRRAVGCPSPGIFRTRFTELVGVPPHVYRSRATATAAATTPWVPQQAERPVGRQESAATASGRRTPTGAVGPEPVLA